MSKIIQSKLPCPKCPSSDAYHLYEDGHGYCFSCNSYVGADDGNDNGNSTRDSSRTVEGHTYEFLSHRGISAEAFRYFNTKTKIDSSGRPESIGFQYPNGAIKIRKLDRKEFFWQGDHRPGLFGIDRFAAGSHKCVTITEGELDAISLWEVLRTPVVSVQSSGSAVADVGACRDWLAGFEKIYLSFDGDLPGREATSRVAQLFEPDKILDVRFTRPDRKDPNSYVEKGELSELKSLWMNARRYLPDTVVSSLAEFKKILEEPAPPSIPYPFTSKLNEMTYGIRRGETILITAQEGVGKTEVMHAIEHSLLKGTDDNVAAIYLEENKRSHLKALASIELGKPVHLPDTNSSPAEEFAAIEALLKKDDRLYLVSNVGGDDPETICSTIRYLVVACSCTHVLLDHITMVVGGRAGKDERAELDNLSTHLQNLVNELNFALIVVSHVNDEGQTRGSRYIAKVANTRIDLARDYLNPDPSVSSRTDFTLAKNRFASKTGPAGSANYDLLTCQWKEEQPWSISKSSEVENVVT